MRPALPGRGNRATPGPRRRRRRGCRSSSGNEACWLLVESRKRERRRQGWNADFADDADPRGSEGQFSCLIRANPRHPRNPRSIASPSLTLPAPGSWSVVEEELAAVQQRPDDVLGRLEPPGGVRFRPVAGLALQVLQRDLALLLSGEAAQHAEVQLVAQLLVGHVLHLDEPGDVAAG